MVIHFPVFEIFLFIAFLGVIAASIHSLFFSEEAKELAQKRVVIDDIPDAIKTPTPFSSYLGWETNLGIPIYLPDKVRSRHVHIMGATGSGKTESVLLNLIDQDANNEYPIVIVDAKGDHTFVEFLRSHPKAKARLLVFDVGEKETSVRYSPLASGSQTEAVSRLFNSMTWSEEFYKTRAREMLLKLAEVQTNKGEKVSLAWLKEALASAGSLAGFLKQDTRPLKITENEYNQLAGLVAQVHQLCHGEVGDLISGTDSARELNLAEAIEQRKVIYFRLPALVDPVTTATIGRLIIADLAYYAATVQKGQKSSPRFIPVFLDEFGSLACPAFLELIAKARSAGLALHFSHQSLGDLKAAGESFASQVSDNSSTKIVLRVYDPDTADTMARTFGNRASSKETRQTVKSNFGREEETGAKSVRDVKEFRADPDLIKSLPTGCAFVLMNHAMRVEGSSGDVFLLRFPLPINYSAQEKKESN